MYIASYSLHLFAPFARNLPWPWRVHWIMRLFAFFAMWLLATPLASAQFLGAGVKLGAAPTKWAGSPGTGPNVSDESNQFNIGPYLELRLPLGFAIEADALYRSVGAITVANIGDSVRRSVTDARSWEFPVMAKYRFPTPVVKPFVLAGPTFRRTGNQTIDSICNGNDCAPADTGVISNAGFTRAGFVLGGGLEWKAGALRLTRYSARTAAPYFTTGTNQTQILFSVGF